MKSYGKYLEILQSIGEIEYAWFTTFNLDPELLEKFLLAPIVSMTPGDLRTAEDYEAMNLQLLEKNIKVWYDFRALNTNSFKRTTIPLNPVDPDDFGADLFHPKVIFLKGISAAWLITGSANLSLSGWGRNKEAMLFRSVKTREQGAAVLDFFASLGADTSSLSKWLGILDKSVSDWKFVHSFQNKTIFEQLGPSEKLTIWSPYFSLNLTGFLKKLGGFGYKLIDIVPDQAEDGKVRVTKTQLNTLNDQAGIRFLATKDEDHERAHHAKVWLTEEQIAVGSWNCTFKATETSADGTYNIEAGIIAPINKHAIDHLLSTLTVLDIAKIQSSTEAELEKEWESSLEPFSLCCRIEANWKTFTYKLLTPLPDGQLLISLPDRPDDLIDLQFLDNRSFKRNFNKVLANKDFAVHQLNGQVVYRGYLEETQSALRPVMGYLHLNDLLDSILRDPSGKTASARVIYELPDNNPDGQGTEPVFLTYENSHSYYRMFVAFQLLFERLEILKNKPEELDHLLYRLPGSLLHIRFLISNITPDSPDQQLFAWFLSQEFNRCVRLTKKIDKNAQLDPLPLPMDLNASRKDKNFLKKLVQDYAYEL